MDKVKKGNNYSLGILALLPPEERDFAIARSELSKYKRGLRIGNPIAGIKKAKRSKDQKAKWREWAIETFLTNPNWDYSKVADHVRETASRQGHKMSNGKLYESSYIKKSIGGTKEEAFILLTNRASGQKR